MSYLKLKNPETVDVRAVYKGQEYVLPAGATKSVPEAAGAFLMETFGFLVIGEDVTEKVKEEVKEVVKEKKVK